MKTRSASIWSLRLITLAVWLLAVLFGAFWAMKFVTVKPVNAAYAVTSPAIAIDSQAIAKLLGAPDLVATKATITPASSNYALFGLATTDGGAGVALIATDGKPAKPYRVGSKVADEWVLKSISRTEAILATGMNAADGMKLDLPVRQPATGSFNTQGAGRTGMPLPAVQPPIPPASGYIPGVGTTSGAGVAAAMTAAANPTAGLTPAQTDAIAQRPLSRFAPGQPDNNARVRMPLTPPTASSTQLDTVPAAKQ